MTDISLGANIGLTRADEKAHHPSKTSVFVDDGATTKNSLRRFSFSEYETDNLTTTKADDEPNDRSDGKPQSCEFVLPSPPISDWSYAMSSSSSSSCRSKDSDYSRLENFVLLSPKNLRYHRNLDRNTPSKSTRLSINSSTNANCSWSAKTDCLEESPISHSSYVEICDEVISIGSDIPREIVVPKSLSKKVPLLRRIARKLFRRSR